MESVSVFTSQQKAMSCFPWARPWKPGLSEDEEQERKAGEKPFTCLPLVSQAAGSPGHSAENHNGLALPESPIMHPPTQPTPIETVADLLQLRGL